MQPLYSDHSPHAGDSAIVLQHPDTDNQTAAHTLVWENYPEVYRFAMLLLRNHTDAHQTARTTLQIAFHQRKQYKGQASPLAWILSFAYLLCQPQLSRDKQALSRAALYLHYTCSFNSGDIGIVLGISQQSARRLVQQARDALPGKPEPPTGKSHKKTTTLAWLALDGELDYQQQTSLETHLGSCQDCQQYTSSLEEWNRNTRNTLNARVQLAQPAAETLDQIAQEILESDAPELPKKPFQIKEISLAAALLVLVLVAGSYFYSLLQPEESQKAPARRETLVMTYVESTPFWELGISNNGRYVVFSSADDSLVPSDTNGMSDIFLLDQVERTIQRVNLSEEGEQADGPSYAPSISADGQWIAFTSHAQNLAGEQSQVCNSSIQPGRHCANIYLYHLQERSLRLVSQSLNQAEGSTGDSFLGTISPDGNRIIYWSSARSLVSDDEATCGGFLGRYNCIDLFIYTADQARTLRVPIERSWLENEDAFKIRTSLGGDFILLPLHETDGAALQVDLAHPQDLYVYNLPWQTFEPVNLNPEGEPGNQPALLGAISADGRYVAFTSSANNLTPLAAGNVNQVFLRDRLENTLTLVSMDSNGNPGKANSGALSNQPGPGEQLSISNDGNFVVFTSRADNIMQTPPPWWCLGWLGSTSGLCSSLFIYDRSEGILVQVNPELSPNGRYLYPQVTTSGKGLFFIESSIECLETCGQIMYWQAGQEIESLIVSNP